MASSQVSARDESGNDSSPKDYLIPAALLVVGAGIFLIYAGATGGAAGIAIMVKFLPIYIAIKVVLGVVACFLTAKIMGASFGYLTSAVLKLAAIFIFPTAMTFFIPYIGWLIALVLYWGLLEWLFDLDGMETIAIAVVIWLVGILALFLVAGMGIAM